MIPKSEKKRILVDLIIRIISAASAMLGLFILLWISYEVLIRGIGAINWRFFTELPTPPGVGGGGLANAIVGTLLITVLATLISVPFGFLAGIYLSEFGGNSKFAQWVRFFTNILMGTPSIIIGIFVYTILVRPLGHFSGYAGAVALAILMLPLVARTTEDMLQLVPSALRESALALGMPRWKVTINVVFRAARKGLITGTLLAVARISGETAPLLFTALNSPYWPQNLGRATANLTVTIFNYAMSPYSDWQNAAWGASFLITFGVLVTTLIVRFFLREKHE
ncbi:MAG: phosphate ABC transporter permease PstA [Calditrichaeota bacterium]|nr:phosphate ABC transporter permease PstA [Calditrichota bacterium]